MEYIIHLLALLSIYAVLGLALDILVGHFGRTSLALGGLFGIGAYTTALLSNVLHDLLVQLGVSMLVTTAFGLLLLSICARIKRDAFVLSTLAIQGMLSCIMNNWYGVTKGAFGIRGIEPANLFGWHLDTDLGLAAVSFFLFLLLQFFVVKVTTGGFGLAMHAIRDDEVFSASQGIKLSNIEWQVFSLSSMLAGVSGCLYANYVTFVDPSSFGLVVSIQFLSMVVIGGAGGLRGPLMGALVMVSLPELLRIFSLVGSASANVRQIILQVLIIIILAKRPQGIFGNYDFKESSGEEK